MKALLHFRAGPRLRARVAALAADGIDVVVVDERDHEGFRREITDVDVLLHVLEPVTRSMIAAAPRLRLIQKIGVGLNTIDLEAAAEHGVRVANMPGMNSQAVAEHTLALMLAVLRRLAEFDRATRDGKGWALSPGLLESAGEISGRTVGLIGYGEVPQRLAPVLRALGATVIHHSRSSVPGHEDGYRQLIPLLQQSDIVSLHVPLTPATTNMIGVATIKLMKKGSLLVNTARGGLVAQNALVEALVDGRIAGAGLDVFADEPLASDSPLLHAPNVVLTPHIAWLTRETLERSLSVAIENCRRLQSDEPLLNEAGNPSSAVTRTTA